MIRRLLIANRGKIVVRIAETAAEMGIAAIAVGLEDDARLQHVRAAPTLGGWPARGRRHIC